MKRKKLILIGMLLIIITGVVIINNNNKKYLKIKGYPNTNIMVTLNGVKQNNFPTKNGETDYYNVDVNCNNADGSWDYENWELVISNLKDETNCSVSFTSSSPTLLYNHIVSLWDETDGTNNIYKETHTINGSTYSEYRYEGADALVNNYVWFNNELWRIIGAFPGGTPATGSGSLGNGAPSTNYTENIIRNDAIGSFAWDKDNTNNWLNAELNTNILNNLYLNSSSGTCAMYSTTNNKPCSFENNGLGNVGDYLENVTWNLGGFSSSSTASNSYVSERGATVYSGNAYVTTAKVGLMYPSDFGYSVPSSSCSRDTSLADYDSTACAGNSWLYKYGYEWTITHSSSSATNAWFLDHYGVLSNSGSAYVADGSITSSSSSVRPVVYLNYYSYVVGGDGSITNPFRIAPGE